MKKRCLPHIVLSFLVSVAAYSGQVSAANPVLKHYDDPNGTYYADMVKLAIAHMDKKYDLQTVPGDRTQVRMVEDVKSGALDIMWAGTSKELEDELEPIRIPLFKGLLGHRLLLIRQGEQAKFDSVNSLEDLKRIPLGQGTAWIDTKILESNGLHLVKTMKYPNLFYMLDGGRFDAFPRAAFEPFAEVERNPTLKLAVENHLMLVYKMDTFLFVNKNQKQLARELEQGLRKAIADGSFDKLFYAFPMVQEAISKGNMKNRKVIKLDNPFNSKDMPVDDPSLWLDVNSLN